jgi:hypothetical protein
MAALDEAPARHFDEDRIVVHHFGHGPREIYGLTA